MWGNIFCCVCICIFYFYVLDVYMCLCCMSTIQNAKLEELKNSASDFESRNYT